jgi:hypothetical protein
MQSGIRVGALVDAGEAGDNIERGVRRAGPGGDIERDVLGQIAAGGEARAAPVRFIVGWRSLRGRRDAQSGDPDQYSGAHTSPSRRKAQAQKQRARPFGRALATLTDRSVIEIRS